MRKSSCQLILGSASPRRRELLRWTWLPFEVVVSDAEEISHASDPEQYVLDLAKLKARDVLKKCESKYDFPVVIGSDTVVVSEGKVLEKPKSKEHAREILQNLSGKEHHVYTAVAIAHPEGEISFAEKTAVNFEVIDADLLELYLETGESMDKAGAYGIQGAALSFIGEVKGSYSNVVGLPVNSTLKALKDLSQQLWPELQNWRTCFEQN